MKIAQVAPLMESVPPLTYGGTERVVSYLTEALVDLGHDVTLFASGDSQTRARLVPVVSKSLRLDPRRPDWLMWHTIMLDQVFQQAPDFDVSGRSTPIRWFDRKPIVSVMRRRRVNSRPRKAKSRPVARSAATTR